MVRTKKDPLVHAEGKKKSVAKSKASEHEAFLLCTGVAVHSIRQLADELENVDDGVYYFHTQNGRNDFAQWMQDVFKDQAFADKMRACHSKDHLRATIYQQLLG